MERITTNDKDHILASLNLFYTKDNEVWIRGGGPEPDYADCTLVDWIVSAAEKHNLDIFSRDAESLGEEMYDAMQFGSDTMEGVIALLHAAAVQAAIMQSHLAAIEDILGDEYDLERLKFIMNTERHGGLIVGYPRDDPGPKGPSGVCPSCGRYEGISWDAKTDASTCAFCGWVNTETALRREQDG